MSGILTPIGWYFIALTIEGFLFGIYSAIFIIYSQRRTTNGANETTTSLLYYCFCTLYVLCGFVFVLDLVNTILQLLAKSMGTGLLEHYSATMVSSIVNGFCDFIAQSILIYRCWIVWNSNIRIVIVPSIFAVVYLALWLTSICSFAYHSSPPRITSPDWSYTVMETSIIMSLAVNALVTGLIVFKITKVYQAVKPVYGKSFGVSGGSNLRSVIFVIIESGMMLFCIQLVWLVISVIPTTTHVLEAYQPIFAIYKMFIGITPTIIQVRVSMGLSFHNQESMIGAASDIHFLSGSRLLTSMFLETEDNISNLPTSMFPETKELIPV